MCAFPAALLKLRVLCLIGGESFAIQRNYYSAHRKQALHALPSGFAGFDDCHLPGILAFSPISVPVVLRNVRLKIDCAQFTHAKSYGHFADIGKSNLFAHVNKSQLYSVLSHATRRAAPKFLNLLVYLKRNFLSRISH